MVILCYSEKKERWNIPDIDWESVLKDSYHWTLKIRCSTINNSEVHLDVDID